MNRNVSGMQYYELLMFIVHAFAFICGLILGSSAKLLDLCMQVCIADVIIVLMPMLSQ